MYSFNQGNCQLLGINLQNNVLILLVERFYYALSGGKKGVINCALAWHRSGTVIVLMKTWVSSIRNINRT